jgi:hypothetical protein
MIAVDRSTTASEFRAPPGARLSGSTWVVAPPDPEPIRSAATSAVVQELDALAITSGFPDETVMTLAGWDSHPPLSSTTLLRSIGT